VLNGDFDYNIYLREMRRTGQNMTRVFTFYRETAYSIPGPGSMNTLAPRPEASVMPWERISGYDTAADGLNKFNLDRWNAAYFDRMKDYVTKCADHGVVCEIVLFCNPYTQDKYDLFPCSPVSNVNVVGSDLASPRMFMTLDAPSIVTFQEQFVRKIVEELNPFDNVYYEICNEPNIPGDKAKENEDKVIAWHTHLARIIRRMEETLPKRHLIAANAHFGVTVSDDPNEPVMRHEDAHYLKNPDIDIVNYHYISAKNPTVRLHFVRSQNAQPRAGAIWHFMRHRGRYRKPIVFDETFSGIVRGHPERYAINRAEAWETILSGGAGYDNLDWSFTPADETGSGQTAIGDGRQLNGRHLREWFSIFRRLLGQFDLSALVPAVSLLGQRVPGYGHAASNDGKGKYILYFVDERLYQFEACPPQALSVALNLPPGKYAVQAFDPRTGKLTDLPMLHSDKIATLEVPAFEQDIAITLDRQTDE
jgi:hypothetical protein